MGVKSLPHNIGFQSPMQLESCFLAEWQSDWPRHVFVVSWDFPQCHRFSGSTVCIALLQGVVLGPGVSWLIEAL